MCTDLTQWGLYTRPAARLITVNYEKRKPGIWKTIFRHEERIIQSQERGQKVCHMKTSFPTIHFGKNKDKIFGLWRLSMKCDNTELLIYVAKLRMNKLRRDEFVPFDTSKLPVEWTVTVPTVSFHCPLNRLSVIHRRSMETRWKKEKCFLAFHIILVESRKLRTQLYSEFAPQCKLNINDKLARYKPITKKSFSFTWSML